MNEEQMKHIANLISQDIEKDKEIERLNNKIDKAIEYLDNLRYVFSPEELKDILKGEDK